MDNLKEKKKYHEELKISRRAKKIGKKLTEITDDNSSELSTSSYDISRLTMLNSIQYLSYCDKDDIALELKGQNVDEKDLEELIRLSKKIIKKINFTRIDDNKISINIPDSNGISNCPSRHIDDDTIEYIDGYINFNLT